VVKAISSRCGLSTCRDEDRSLYWRSAEMSVNAGADFPWDFRHGPPRRGAGPFRALVAQGHFGTPGGRSSRCWTIAQQMSQGYRATWRRPLRDCGFYIDAHPGLRCACPGLLSVLPPGEGHKRFGFHSLREKGVGGLIFIHSASRFSAACYAGEAVPPWLKPALILSVLHGG
jgi:hypothetical protein